MTYNISVILPAYNPNPARLSRTLASLQHQTLPYGQWELIIVDNNSAPPLQADISWHPHSKIVIAEDPGLTYARIKGFEYAMGSLMVMVDDDNVIDADYLKNTLAIFSSNGSLGAIGGKSVPAFEIQPPEWLKEFYDNLALRDMGEAELLTAWKNEYPVFAPIGAGMAIRKAAIASYVNRIKTGDSVIADRKGTSLYSGGDNDIILEILKSGWQVGYFPSLVLKHIIPESRMQPSYLARLLNNTNQSWVQVLNKHQISPWAGVPLWTVPFRKIKAWINYKAWQDNANYIKWRGACGLFDGLAEIKRNAKT